jgi:prophage maintenance system killer protein
VSLSGLRFLSVDDVLAIHENTVVSEGGLGGLRDSGLLDSAVLMPQQQFGGEYLHSDLAAMAADPHVQSELRAIEREFSGTEMDECHCSSFSSSS